jgi:hypothetical protein
MVEQEVVVDGIEVEQVGDRYLERTGRAAPLEVVAGQIVVAVLGTEIQIGTRS